MSKKCYVPRWFLFDLSSLCHSMKRTEHTVYDQCPECAVQVYRGPIRVKAESGVMDVCDVRGDSVPCPSCDCELLHSVELEWDDNCWLCGKPFADDNFQMVEWIKARQCYRWWCNNCVDNIIALFVAEFSRPLARLCYTPMQAVSQWIIARWERQFAKQESRTI